MKKMSKWKESGLDFGISGSSTERGIMLMAEKEISDEDVNFVSILTSRYPGAFAFLNNDGRIEIDPEIDEKIQKQMIEKDMEKAKENRKLKLIFSVLSLGCFLGIIPGIMIHDYMMELLLGLSFIFYGCGKISYYISSRVKAILGDKEIRQSFRFHAAEHAVINAYYDLKRVPTIEEIKDYSIFAYGCGVISKMRLAWVPIGIGICRLAPGLWYFPALAIFLIFSWWAGKQKYFFIEAIALDTPTDFEYEAAIKCMEATMKKKEKMDELMSKDMPTIIMEILEGDGCIPIFAIHIGEPEDMQEDD